MKKHFVTFCSPGTFMAEQSTKEIDSWDIETAINMSKTIKERYGAIPYGFYFTTRERTPGDFDSKKTAQSGMYYLGGRVLTIEALIAEDNPENKILISNMQINKWDRVIINENSWRWTQPLRKDDIVLEI